MSAVVNAVAVVNRSELADAEVAIIVEAYRAEVGRFCAAWGLPVPGLAVYGRNHQQAVDEEAAVIFTDSTDVPDAYGYHTALGVAYWGYVDVGLCQADGEPVSRVFGHELWELLADAPADAWVGPFPDGSHVAKEVSDPVARKSRTREVDDPVLGKGEAEIADYVLPAWFDPMAQAGTWSDQGAAPGPLEDAPGGYHTTEKAGGVVAGPSARVRSYGRTMRRLLNPPSQGEPTAV